jgi:hypothetical protein
MNIDRNSSHIVYVNSLDRVSGTTSNFTFNINFPQDIRYNKVVVLDALIPKSYYLIANGYNTFQLKEGASTVTVTMPVGNYTYAAFKSITAQVLTSTSPNGWVYTCTSGNPNTSPDTGKFTWSVAGNGGVQPAFIFAKNMYENFGFDSNSTNTFVGNSLTCTNIPKLQVEDRLFIGSNLIIGSSNQVAILQEVNAAPSPSFSSITYQCTCPEYYAKYINNTASSTFSFVLMDEHGQNIDLNGLPCAFTLMFYQENDIWSKLRSFLRLASVKLAMN